MINKIKEDCWKKLEEQQFVDELKEDIFKNYDDLIKSFCKCLKRKLKSDVGTFIDGSHYKHTVKLINEVLEINKNE